MHKLITILLFTCLLVSRFYLQPFYSIISDCDETFNYWEPLNLLLRNFGKQTWEYSPIYSIRSWAMLMPFYSLLYPVQKFINWPNNTIFFVLTRIILATWSITCEWKLFKEIANSLSQEIAHIWLFIQIFNPGYFHASTELLPSSIAMITHCLSIKYALSYLSINSISNVISSVTFNFITAMLGWPFVIVLSIPICLHYAFTHSMITSLRTIFDCTLVFSLLSMLIIGIDSVFYGKFTPVSWNILLYNVLNASDESGPNIFGVEPWYYYVINLVLNFPLPVLVFGVVGCFHKRIWPLSASLVLWISIFITQPHKEERFLYPIYGLITLTASIGIFKFINYFQKWKPLQRLLRCAIYMTILLQATSRILALVNNYSAPFHVYEQLYNQQLNRTEIMNFDNKEATINVCTGREWFRFPNSFFLPDHYRLKFVASGFNGLLPGDFTEDKTTIFQTVRHSPPNMNNLNHFEKDKIVELDECTYFVDTMELIDPELDAFSPWDTNNWDKLYCYPIINAQESRLFGRVFYMPQFINKFMEQIPFINKKWSEISGAEHIDYCLFHRNPQTVQADFEKQV